MADIACYNVHKNYGANHILKGITFEIYEGERVGLLGKNGAGKTTLFKILKGDEPFEEGQVFISKGKQVEVLDQIPEFPKDYTVKDVLVTGFDYLLSLQAQMKELESRMSLRQDPALLKQYGELSTLFEAKGGYMMETDLAKVCEGLLIDRRMQDELFYRLSGGEQTRVNLARIILKKPDILLLDEPTNHLDIRACEWLEEYLGSFKGTVVVISHDRYFLDKIVTRIIEIENGKAVLYSGNYTKYAREKEERLIRQQEMYEQEQKKIKQLEEAAKRLHDWGDHTRAFAMEKRIERIRKTEKPQAERELKAEFREMNFGSKDFIKIRNVSKYFGDHQVLKDISLLVRKGDRIGLLGPNGCGKTTLLNIITGNLKPDSGEVILGNSVRFAFLPQIVRFDRPELSILDTVRYEMEWSEDMARNRLAAFNFTGEDVFKSVSSLSGGEKSRLKLFLLMQQEINLLILDEPTNHLDIQSREWIERTLESFGGTLLFVSHDRYFISKFATRIWDLNNGVITDYVGTYEDYRRWKKDENNCQRTVEKERKKPERNAREKVNLKEIEKKLKAIEREIAAYEQELGEIDRQMEEAASDYQRLQELLEEKEKLKTRIDALYENWEELSELVYR